MIKEGKIGVQEAVWLVVTATANRIFFTAPTVVVQFTGTAGWYMTLISNMTAIVAFTFIYLLLKRFPGKNILEIFDIAFGRFIGFVLSFVFAGSFLMAGGILIREFIDVLKVYIFPNSPPEFLIFAFLIVVATAVYLGLETIARVTKLAAYTSLGAFLALLILSFNNIRTDYLFPILGYGFGKTVIEGLSRSSAFSEIIILAVIAGSIQGIEHIKKAGYISLVVSGLIISVGIMFLLLVFPYYSLQELTAPLFVLARAIKYGSFLQRLDPLFLILWVTVTVLAVSIVMYASVSCYCKTFRFQDTKPAVIPITILVFIVTLVPRDFTEVVNKYIELLRIYPILLFYVLPLVTFIVVTIRKKGGKTVAS